MVDGIKIFQGYIEEAHSEFLLNKFTFGGYFDLTDGDEIPVCSRKNKGKDYNSMIWRKAVHRDMEIYLGWKSDVLTKMTHWNLMVKGSLQKYACNGNNSGLFTAPDAVSALNKLCNSLRIDKIKAKFTRFELAVNTNLSELKYSTENYCELFLLRYKTYPFKWMETGVRNEKIGKIAELTHRQIKIYCKGNNVLRFEIHWSDMQELRDKYSLSTLDMLTEELIVRMASELLPSTFLEVVSLNGIVLEDKYLPANLKAKDRQILKDYANQIYLVQMDHLIQKAGEEKNKKEWERLRKKDQRYRNRFHDLVNSNICGDQSNELILHKIKEAIESAK